MDRATQRLTPLEIDVLSTYGIRRFSASISQGVGGNKAPRSFDYLANSAMSEYVVARALGVFFDLDNSGKSDIYIHAIGAKIEVRHSRAADASLLVQQKDRDDAVYVLVTGAAPDFTIEGFASGAAAKRQHYWNAEMQCFRVPQHDLISFDVLQKRIAERCKAVQTAT